MRVYASKAAEVAQLYKALGDETRVRIAHLLSQLGELCVCDVETILGASQSKASRHLNYLKQAGIVEDRRDGTWVYYRLSRSARPLVQTAIRALAGELAEDPAALADLAEAARCKRAADCAPIELVSPRARKRE